MNSPVGCDFLVTMVESGVSPEDLADPKVSLSLAAVSADSVNRFNADHDLIAAEPPALARERAAHARAVVEHPGTAWWPMRFLEDVRVFEIHGPVDWYDLCTKYPAKYKESRSRLAPNWGAVAEEWDGV